MIWVFSVKTHRNIHVLKICNSPQPCRAVVEFSFCLSLEGIFSCSIMIGKELAFHLHAEENYCGWVGGCNFRHILRQSKNGFDCLKIKEATQVNIADGECTLIIPYVYVFWFCQFACFTVNL